MEKNSTRHILFVGHNGSRTGAPKILLGLIKSFREISNFTVTILLVEGGPLVQEFQALAPTYVLYKESALAVSSSKGFYRFWKKLYYYAKAMWILYKLSPPDLVFLNTITNGLIHKKLLRFNAKFITYVHELAISILANTNEEALNTSLSSTDVFFTGSVAVKQLLQEKYKIHSDKLKVVYSSVEKVALDKFLYVDFIAKFRKVNRLNDNAFVVGISGTSEWRKGFDLLPSLVKIHFDRFPDSNAVFVWKGCNDSRAIECLEFDLQKFRLSNRVRLLPHDGDGLSVISVFDLHLLLAREDPYPLVVLEAASFSIPTICFSQAGGAPEFVGNTAGIVIDYGNLYAMAEAINELETNSALREELGKNALLRLSKNHHTADAARELEQVIETLLYETPMVNRKFASTV